MKSRIWTAWLVFRCILLLSFFAGQLALFYLTFHGFPETSVRALERKLRFDGVVVQIGAVKLSVFEGLLVKDVYCYRKRDIGDPFLEIGEAVLEFDPVRWFRGEHGLKGVEFRNGVLRFGGGDVTDGVGTGISGYPGELRLDGISLLLPADRAAADVEVAGFAAEHLGVKITGRGIVRLAEEIKPESFARVSPAVSEREEKTVIREPVQELARQIETLASENAVIADIDFVFDLRDMRGSELEILLQSRSRSAPVENGRAGTCSARVGIRGGRGDGSISLRDQVLYGVPLEDASLEFGFDESAFILRRLDAILGRGALSMSTSSYCRATGQYEGTFSSGFDPRILLDPVRERNENTAKVIEDFLFPFKPPVFDAAFEGVTGDDWRFSMSGTARAENSFYRGVSNAWVEAEISVSLTETNRLMAMSPLSVKMEDEKAVVHLFLDFMSETVEFKGNSTADPRQVARMITPFMDELVGNFRFEGPVEVVAAGIAGFTDEDKNDINIGVQGLRFGWDRFLCDKGSLNIKVLGRRVDLTDIMGTAYGGNFEAEVSILGTDMRYEVEALVDNVDFGVLMHEISGGDEEAFRGRCSARVKLEGYAGPGGSETVSGHGEVEIARGHVFQIPLFGELSNLMTKFVPGLGLVLRQTDAKASVVIEDGRICSNDIIIEGDVFSLRGKGCCSLAGDLSFNAQFVLLRQRTLVGEVVRMVTLPVSKIFEFRLSGTLDKPRWRPVYLPKEMFLMFGRDDDR